MSKGRPDIVDKVNQALIAGRPLVMQVTEMAELAAFINNAVESAMGHAAMLNTYVERQQGQVSYEQH